MPNKPKIVGEVEKMVRELCEKGYNVRHIGLQVGVARDTVKKWAMENGYILAQKTSTRIIDLEPKIVEMLKDGYTRKQIQKTLEVHYTQVTDIATKNNLTALLRTRKDSALDKILSDEEVKQKIADGSAYIGFNKTRKKYEFRCAATGKTFYKSSAKIDQGSPFGKSGFALTEQEFGDRLAKINYTLEPGSFTKTKAPAIVYCPKGHKRELLRASYAFKFDCPVCGNNGTSKIEQEILAWVQEYYPSAHKYKFQERKTKPKEIYIYIPELKFGIEFCGLHFHCENDLSEESADENKHYQKMLAANRLGIRLITIFENEWNQRKEQVKSFVLSAIKKNGQKIMARKCEIKEISIETAQGFLDKTHIQGADKSTVRLGLFCRQELVAVMTGGGHPQRPNQNVETLFLNRLAFKADVTVVGGASRLFSKLKIYAKEKGYKNIISWSDNRWSEGGIYLALGFSFDSQKEKGRGLSDGSIWPDFQYVLNGRLCSRETIKGLGLKELDLNKIYDCGKKRWIYTL